MNELKDELNAALIDDWHVTPITENHHKWLLEWYRSEDDGEFVFDFVSPKKRRYTYYVDGGGVPSAEIVAANGDIVASYYDSWDDKPKRKDTVLRLTPKHIIYRLYVLLGALSN